MYLCLIIENGFFDINSNSSHKFITIYSSRSPFYHVVSHQPAFLHLPCPHDHTHNHGHRIHSNRTIICCTFLYHAHYHAHYHFTLGQYIDIIFGWTSSRWQ